MEAMFIMQKQAYSVGIVGATGLVGQALRQLLRVRSFPIKELRLFASEDSAGQIFDGSIVEVVDARSFDGLDGVFLCVDARLASSLAPQALAQGCWVIDNSAAFRLNPEVPLIVPEVNLEALEEGARLIANPNCSTIIALMALAPLHRAFRLRACVASTYQAVSGSGVAASEALLSELEAVGSNQYCDAQYYRHPIAMNVIPEVDAFLEDGSTREELKMCEESRKILSLPSLRVASTCVRVPVARAHAIALTAGFELPVSKLSAEKILASAPGLIFCKEPEAYPTPLSAAMKAECFAGRLRTTDVFEHGLALWVVGDQLWKGAALNAVQIAERLIAQK